jgi:myo-inositol 2-dehydrogenase/D-chiro-inositol 1-dehydrogenase
MRVGLAGAGRIGAMHAAVLADLPGVDEVVVADIDPDRAAKVAAPLGLTAADGTDALFAAGRVDAVVVATSTDSHPQLVLAAAEAGLPVFVEKPVAADIPGTLEVMRALDDSDVVVQVGYQRRFDPGYLAAREAVTSGRLGWIHTLRSCTLDPGPPPPAYIAASGGFFRDCAVHDIDSIRWITGREVVSVYAVGANRGVARGDHFFAEYDDVDTLTALLTLDDDTLATVSCTRYNAAGYDVRLEVFGSDDSVSVGLDDRTPLRSTEPGVSFPAGPAYPLFPERFAAAYAAELTAFLALARDGGSSPCTPVDALEAFYVAEAGELSRREGRPVALSEVRR